MEVNPSEVVIWSADVDEETLWRRLGDGSHGLKKVKIDRFGLGEMGFGIMNELSGAGYDVFADAKIAEIPDKVMALTHQHLKHRPWMLNCMAGIISNGVWTDAVDEKNRDALKRFADACHAVGTLPCAVTVLTSKQPELIAREFNKRTSIDQVLVYVDMMYEAGFSDIVCSPLECAAIRKESRFEGMSINTPGVRLPGSDTRDQARTGTPSWAIQQGATRLVIGQDLTSGDLAERFQLIANDLALVT